MIDRGNAVLRYDEDAHLVLRIKIDEFPRKSIDIPQFPGHLRSTGAIFLQAVIEVRQVHQAEIRLMLFLNPAR